MLGQFTRQDQSDGCLDLSGRDCGLLVVGSQLGSLGSNTLEDIYRRQIKGNLRKRDAIEAYR